MWKKKWLDLTRHNIGSFLIRFPLLIKGFSYALANKVAAVVVVSTKALNPIYSFLAFKQCMMLDNIFWQHFCCVD